jgi:hypothetical protein
MSEVRVEWQDNETFNRLTWNGDNRTTRAADTRVVWE